MLEREDSFFGEVGIQQDADFWNFRHEPPPLLPPPSFPLSGNPSTFDLSIYLFFNPWSQFVTF